MLDAPSILLLSADAGRRRGWAEILASTPAHLAFDLAELSPLAPPEVIVTDGTLDMPAFGGPAHYGGAETAVVAVGEGLAGDVSLVSDCSAGELRLACQLLGEIVGLRRERRRTAQERNELRDLAARDPLTGLPNRRAWDEELDLRWQAVAKLGRSLCVAVFDVDHFKRINDECGHGVGDAVLRALARRLATSVRSGDLAARLGGDEFGVLIFDLPANEAAAVVERIRCAMQVGRDDVCPWDVTASAGFALHPAEPKQPEIPSPHELYHLADEALRRAKSQRRRTPSPPTSC